MSSKSSVSAVLVERLFVAGIVLLCILLVTNFIFVSGLVRTQSTALNHKRIDLEAEENKQKTIKELDTTLQEKKDEIEKTKFTMANIGFTSDFESRISDTQLQYENLTFQEQFIYDAQNYAKQSGIKIASYTFPTDSSASGATGATTPAAGATPAAGSTASPSTATTPAAGTATPGALKLPSTIQATTIKINFGNDGKIPYTSFLKFLRLLEDNNIRMNIASLKLTPDTDDKKKLSQADLDIIIFSRKK